jgi:hypothetical protein
VDDPLLVGRLEGLGDLPGDLPDLVDGEGPPLQPLGEILALDQLQDEEGAPVVLLQAVDGPDVGVVEGGEQRRLALEPSEALGIPGDLGGQHLDRHVTVQLPVPGPVDLPHSSGPEGLEDLVGTQVRSGRQRHAGGLPGDRAIGRILQYP